MRFFSEKKSKNIVHCTTQKVGSQWFKKLFHDPLILKKTKLDYTDFEHYFNDKIKGSSEENYYSFSRDLYERNFVYDRKITYEALAASMYLSYESAKKMLPNDNYKLFFILRDPRDIIVSVYFSMKHSHPIINTAASSARTVLEKAEFKEGMKWCIDTTVNKSGLFEGQRSWVNANLDTDKEKIFRFEDFTNRYEKFMHELFRFLNLPLTENDKNLIINKYKFEFLTDRNKGVADTGSHYRKGTSEQWIEYFTPELIEYFKLKTGDLVEELGYSWNA